MADDGAPTGSSSATHAVEDQPTNRKAFAVVNTSELLERLAYYGVLSVNALYLSSLGYSSAVIGLLSAILLPLPYVVPMLVGPIAGKVGYKPVMLLAFVAYASGFLLIATWSAIAGLVLGIILVGVGAGMFKPLTAAAIAHVTSLKHRTLGYSIYYTGINVGGFIGPLLMTMFGHHYRLAYLLGAGAIGVDFVFILLLFRNPLEPRRDLSIAKSFEPLVEVLGNRRFLALLAIFSGFWMLYSMNFVFVILYLQRFVDLPSWFKPGLQVSLESLCVMILGVPLGALASRWEGIRTMLVGVALLLIGFLVIGFLPFFPAYVLGVLIVATGEVLAYPGFLSYVSRIAPRDKVAVYQSFGFLPLFVGFLVGPIVGGWLYGPIAQRQGRTALFWALMGCIGIITLTALLLYDRANRPRASVAPGLTATSPPSAATPWWKGNVAATVVLLLGVAIVLAGLASGSRIPVSGPSGGDVAALAQGTEIGSFQGTTAEGRSTTQAVAVPQGVGGNMSILLTWSDEAPSQGPSPLPVPGASNAPDKFHVDVKDRFGVLLASGDGENPVGEQGNVLLTFHPTESPGDLSVSITLVSAGDTQSGPFTTAQDTGNAWTLKATVA